MRAINTAVLVAGLVLVTGALSAMGLATTGVTLAVPGRSNATPSIAASGPFVAVVWSASAPGGATDIYAATSRNGADSFGAPVRVNDAASAASVSGEQPPRVVLIPHAGRDASVVVTWTTKSPAGTRIVSARSDDGGTSFAKAQLVPGGDAAGSRGWESTAGAADGSVLSIWLDHRETAMPAMSGAAMEHDHLHMQPADSVAKAQLSKLYFSDGKDGARALAAGVCYCCKTSLAATPDGSVYAVWRHVYPGNIRDIAFTVSRDGGKTFTSPIRVSEDRWALDGCPENGPALAVRGRDVHVIWPTVVAAAAGGEPTMSLFYSVTHDGRTFAPRVSIPTQGTPRHPQIAIDPSGSLSAVWDEAGEGTRRVVIGRAAAAEPTRFTREVIAGAGADQYPVVAVTERGSVVAWVSGAPDRSVIRVSAVASR